MPSLPLCAAIYLIWWWLAFFAMLPIGVRSHEEAGVPSERGNDPGAPVAAGIRKKMLWAALAALVLSGATIVMIVIDPFNLRPDIGG